MAKPLLIIFSLFLYSSCDLSIEAGIIMLQLYSIHKYRALLLNSLFLGHIRIHTIHVLFPFSRFIQCLYCVFFICLFFFFFNLKYRLTHLSPAKCFRARSLKEIYTAEIANGKKPRQFYLPFSCSVFGETTRNRLCERERTQ